MGDAGERIAELRAPVALCLSGGGARGAAQAGVAVELIRHGLRPDLVVGASIGAWNGAWIAAHPQPGEADRMLRFWTDPETRRMFRGMLLGYAGAVARRRNAAFTASRIQRFLRQGMGDRTSFEDLALPLVASAVDLLTGDLVYFDSGPIAPALLASAAIPTVLPPVAMGGRLLVDGGVVDNYGVEEAIRRGARSIVLIDAGINDVTREPVGLLELIDRAVLVGQIHQRRRALESAAEVDVPVHLFEVGALGAVLNFDGAAAAIEDGRAVARAWLTGEPVGPLASAGPRPPRGAAWRAAVVRARSGLGAWWGRGAVTARARGTDTGAG